MAPTKTMLWNDNAPILKSTFLFWPTSLVVYCPICLFSSGSKMLSFHSELLLSSHSLSSVCPQTCSHRSIETALTCVPIAQFGITWPISRSLLVQQTTPSSLTSSPLVGFRDNTSRAGLPPASCSASLLASPLPCSCYPWGVQPSAVFSAHLTDSHVSLSTNHPLLFSSRHHWLWTDLLVTQPPIVAVLSSFLDSEVTDPVVSSAFLLGCQLDM